MGEIFEGWISGIMRKGFFVELVDLPVEGFVSAESIPGDIFSPDENGIRLTGRHTSRSFVLGRRGACSCRSRQRDGRRDGPGTCREGIGRAQREEKEERGERKRQRMKRPIVSSFIVMVFAFLMLFGTLMARADESTDETPVPQPAVPAPSDAGTTPQSTATPTPQPTQIPSGKDDSDDVPTPTATPVRHPISDLFMEPTAIPTRRPSPTPPPEGLVSPVLKPSPTVQQALPTPSPKAEAALTSSGLQEDENVVSSKTTTVAPKMAKTHVCWSAESGDDIDICFAFRNTPDYLR